MRSRSRSSAPTLPPGTAVLLYTDGLVERRGQAINDGLQRLVAEVDARRTAPIAGDLAHAFHDADHADDVCLLVLRLAGELTAPG